jgi:hypothetical protein
MKRVEGWRCRCGAVNFEGKRFTRESPADRRISATTPTAAAVRPGTAIARWELNA